MEKKDGQKRGQAVQPRRRHGVKWVAGWLLVTAAAMAAAPGLIDWGAAKFSRLAARQAAEPPREFDPPIVRRESPAANAAEQEACDG